MSKPTNKAAAFLQALNTEPETPTQASTSEAPAVAKPARAVSRSGLKHIGGYFDQEDVEKIAILRARLKLDNSQLIKLAIEELYRKHAAKRAFGD